MIHADAFIEVDKDITLRRLSRENAQEKFDLIIANHDHLLPWLPWADFYHEIDDMYNYTDSEIEKFDNGIAFSYDIYYKDQLAGSIDFNHVSAEKKLSDVRQLPAVNLFLCIAKRASDSSFLLAVRELHGKEALCCTEFDNRRRRR